LCKGVILIRTVSPRVANPLRVPFFGFDPVSGPLEINLLDSFLTEVVQLKPDTVFDDLAHLNNQDIKRCYSHENQIKISTSVLTPKSARHQNPNKLRLHPLFFFRFFFYVCFWNNKILAWSQKTVSYSCMRRTY